MMVFPWENVAICNNQKVNPIKSPLNIIKPEGKSHKNPMVFLLFLWGQRFKFRGFSVDSQQPARSCQMVTGSTIIIYLLGLISWYSWYPRWNQKDSKKKEPYPPVKSHIVLHGNWQLVGFPKTLRQSNMACWKIRPLWMIFPLKCQFTWDFPACHV